jgi:hypothetical protein
MPPWLLVYLSRWLGGERLRKATPYDYRWHFGFLFLFPVLTVLFLKCGKRFFDASIFTVWLYLTVYGLVGFFVCIVWARFVPATVSLVLAVLAWAVWIIFFNPFTFKYR